MLRHKRVVPFLFIPQGGNSKRPRNKTPRKSKASKEVASKTELEISATFVLRTEARRSLSRTVVSCRVRAQKSGLRKKQQHLLEYKAWKLQFRFFLVHTTRAQLKTIPGFLSSFFGGQASLVSFWVGMPGLDLR